ncbi:unnamed protein product [Ixodes hexagonus]
MSSLCFVCQLPILSHQTWGTWPHHQDSDSDDEDEPQDDDEEGETCLSADAAQGEGAAAQPTVSKKQTGRTPLIPVLNPANYVDASSSVVFWEFLQETQKETAACRKLSREGRVIRPAMPPKLACPGSPCEQYPHFIKAAPGYWIECAGPRKESDALPETTQPDASPGKTNGAATSGACASGGGCNSLGNVSGALELVSRDEDTYEKFFYGTEHWNYFTNDESLGPVLMSLKQENINNRDQFRSDP